MENVFLKPALDANGNAMVVPDPDTHSPLKAEGEWKPMSMYWVRRIRDKDAIESVPTAELLFVASDGESQAPTALAAPAAAPQGESKKSSPKS